MQYLKIFTFLLLFMPILADTFSVQGVLRDPLGDIIDDNAVNVTFRLYEGESGGIAIWEETQNLSLLHGVFQAEVGSVNQFDDIPFDQTYWLGMTVEGDAEMTPRFKLQKTPVAMSMIGQNNVFSSAGNVGIGTREMEAKLHVVPKAPDDDILKVENSTGTGFVVDDTGDLQLTNGAKINFEDGSEINSADFGGTANEIKANGNVILTVDADNDENGDMQFVIADSLQLKVDREGVRTSGVAIGGAYPGSLVIFAGTVAPEGWLICDGSELSPEEFPNLYDVIGDTYGAGDGSFYLPDLRGRGPMGFDETQENFNELGKTGGSKNHALTSHEMPSHLHQIDFPQHGTDSFGEAHQHDFPEPYYDGSTYDKWARRVYPMGDSDDGVFNPFLYGNDTNCYDSEYIDGSSSGGSHSHSFNFGAYNSSYTGNGQSHNITFSYLSLNYIIKY